MAQATRGDSTQGTRVFAGSLFHYIQNNSECQGKGYIQRNEKRSQIIRSSTPESKLRRLYSSQTKKNMTIIKTQSTSNTNQNSSQEKSWRSVFPSRSLLRWPVEISPLVATRSRLRQLGPVFSALQMASPTLEAAGPWRRVKAGPRPCWDWVFTQARSAFLGSGSGHLG